MKVANRLVIRVLGRSLAMLGAAAVALWLYRAAQDAGSAAFGRNFAATPEVPDPRGELFLLTFWIILPAALSTLAVAVPAMRMRLSPRAVFTWSVAVPTVAVAPYFSHGYWWETFVAIGLVHFASVLILAWLLARAHRKAWIRHGLRRREAFAREITI